MASSCTHNPFGDDQIEAPGAEIRGQVLLQDGSSPEGVYVWLEHFAAGTWTDGRGEFRLFLSTTGAQAGTGVTGSFRLFFYLGNYALRTAEVVLRNGMIVPGYGDIDAEGALRRPVILPRLLSVTTEVQPDSFPPAVGGDVSPGSFQGTTIVVTVTLRADMDSLPVLLPNRRAGPAALLLIRGLDPGSNVQLIPQESLGALLAPLVPDTITPEGRSWSGGFYLAKGALPAGRYEVVPYVLVPQSSLPDELLASLGVTSTPGVSYLKLPFKRRQGVLTVLR
ncbi:MAG: hypothetical protein QHJ34_15980 [bacterium]|nr:hypothetical protein [candidate division KSB1 bacterium]MDH7561702.1 hypothetical protein [bacterium]